MLLPGRRRSGNDWAPQPGTPVLLSKHTTTRYESSFATWPDIEIASFWQRASDSSSEGSVDSSLQVFGTSTACDSEDILWREKNHQSEARWDTDLELSSSATPKLLNESWPEDSAASFASAIERHFVLGSGRQVQGMLFVGVDRPTTRRRSTTGQFAWFARTMASKSANRRYGRCRRCVLPEELGALHYAGSYRRKLAFSSAKLGACLSLAIVERRRSCSEWWCRLKTTWSWLLEAGQLDSELPGAAERSPAETSDWQDSSQVETPAADTTKTESFSIADTTPGTQEAKPFDRERHPGRSS